MVHPVPQTVNAVRVYTVEGLTHHESYYREPFPPVKYCVQTFWQGTPPLVEYLSHLLAYYQDYWVRHHADTDAAMERWRLSVGLSQFQSDCADLACA